MANFSEELIVYADPKSATSEAIRCLRTNIQFLNVGKKSQVVLLSSAAPQEGKSFVTANLAVVTAQSGKKTVLMDCDMRRPHLHKLFGILPEKGLSSVLAEETVSLKELPFCDTGIENLVLIPCGPIPPNPSELLGHEIMDKLLSVLRERFEIIYIDTPPLLTVTDPILLSKKADGVILIVMADFTPKNAAIRSYNCLKEAGANVIGTVLNKVDVARSGYYRYRYYKYYKSYYGKDEKEK